MLKLSKWQELESRLIERYVWFKAVVFNGRCYQPQRTCANTWTSFYLGTLLALISWVHVTQVPHSVGKHRTNKGLTQTS